MIISLKVVVVLDPYQLIKFTLIYPQKYRAYIVSSILNRFRLVTIFKKSANKKRIHSRTGYLHTKHAACRG
jgi:hypothetical protein